MFNNWSRKVFYVFFFVVIVIVYVRGLFVPLMNNDSAHHALIAMRMVETSNYWELYFRDADYLDKPHFLFWAAAGAFKTFGINAFAYKFPSFLFSILAVYATYRLGKELFGRRAGYFSATILATSYAFMLANNDVRMDAILTSSIIFSTWRLIRFANGQSFMDLLLSALGIAVGVATKGAIGAVMPLLAVVFFLVQKKQWRLLLAPRWIVMAAVVLILLLPVFYGFYHQFDLHPEKVINGRTHVSGVSFFLFSQSVERYRGTVWGATNTDPFFFFHTALWAFLPWSILLVVAFGRWIRWFVRNGLKDDHRYPLFLFATVVVMLLILSGAGFKLPHYLNILFPFFALITASYLSDVDSAVSNRVVWCQIVLTALLVTVISVLNTWSFPIKSPWILVVASILLFVYVGLLFTKPRDYLLVTLASVSFSYFVMNFNFFPQIMEHQAGTVLGDRVRRIPDAAGNEFYLEGSSSANSFDFTVGRIIKPIDIHSVLKRNQPTYFFTDKSGKLQLKKNGVLFHQIDSCVDFRVSQINLRLLNPEKRKSFADMQYLLKVD